MARSSSKASINAVAPRIGRAASSARRDAAEHGRLIDHRVEDELLSIPTEELFLTAKRSMHLVDNADLSVFRRVRLTDGLAPASAGHTEDLGLVIYTGAEVWVAVGEIWGVFMLQDARPELLELRLTARPHRVGIIPLNPVVLTRELCRLEASWRT